MKNCTKTCIRLSKSLVGIFENELNVVNYIIQLACNLIWYLRIIDTKNIINFKNGYIFSLNIHMKLWTIKTRTKVVHKLSISQDFIMLWFVDLVKFYFKHNDDFHVTLNIKCLR